MQTPFSLSDTGAPQKLDFTATIRNLLINMIGFGVLAVAIYLTSKNFLHTSDTVALFLTGVPSLIHMLFGIIRKRSINFFSGLMLFLIVLSIVLTLIGGNPRLFLLRQVLLTVAIGLAYLVSLLFSRPLFFYLARYFVTGEHAENRAWFDDYWQYPYFRSSMRLSSIYLGGVCFVSAAVTAVMVLTLPIPVYLAIENILSGVFYLAMTGWIFLYMRHLIKRIKEIKAQTAV